MAVGMLLEWATYIANEKIYPIFKQYLQQFGTSQNEHQRAAATAILGVIADNDACLPDVRDDIDPLTNFLVDRLSD